MWQSLLIKLGMFAVTLSVVFWIGWTLPASFDPAQDLTSQPFEGSQPENVSGRERAAEVSLAPVTVVSNQPSTAATSKRSHKNLLNLNQATEQDFDALPGIGARLAERIIAYRQSVGTFHSLDELRQVKGIGSKKFERIRPLITVMPDSESASREKKRT
ncbi:MAG TPA: ComEA family DNA-binding protein [Nitrospiraceae bacterium]|nr:ComEA family DNA-binding protein [Nitrospiraceae bacterium]